MTSITKTPLERYDIALGPPAASLEVWEQKFREDLVADVSFESNLTPNELWIVLLITLLVVLREVLL